MAVGLWAAYGDSLLVDGASRLRTIPPLMSKGREGLLTAFLAAFGRAIAEVGAIIIVAGNVRDYTRIGVVSTIAMHTSYSAQGQNPLLPQRNIVGFTSVNGH